MSLILFIDTAYTHTHIALGDETGILAEQLHEQANEQAAFLNLMIADLLASQGAGMSAVAAVAVDGGPGSYTGLRVGMGVAKGLCFALDKPLMVFNKLELLEKQAIDFLLILKARTGEGFAFARSNGVPFLPPQHIFYEHFDWAAFKAMALITDDASVMELQPNAKDLKSHILDMSHWHTIAWSRWAGKDFDDIAYAEPFYLKSAFTTSPKKKI
ncbi:MAG: tRNA (adenosine(37)-N6)-threonylcarbamoyltransferase complex dimerization subunit type 1 TsaB [Sphingobacteriales bacterium]|nr:MAG: tRNA (adenosine(37)-N6)-threonylcarbamoyltransferase complex dimerization subunit type 1 TsaB [Sphingobacteriales bacterium]